MKSESENLKGWLINMKSSQADVENIEELKDVRVGDKHITIEPQVHEKFKEICQKKGLKMNVEATRILMDYVLKEEQEQGEDDG